jgi:hypothetical protein
LTHAEKFNIQEQQAKFRKYILTRYQVIATQASQVAISGVGRCEDHRDSSQKPKKTQSKNQLGQQKQQKGMVNGVSQQPTGRFYGLSPQKAHPSCLGQSVCQEAHQLEKCDKFHEMSPKQSVVKVNELCLPQIT